jgi:hypothetical protein
MWQAFGYLIVLGAGMLCLFLPPAHVMLVAEALGLAAALALVVPFMLDDRLKQLRSSAQELATEGEHPEFDEHVSALMRDFAESLLNWSDTAISFVRLGLLSLTISFLAKVHLAWPS